MPLSDWSEKQFLALTAGIVGGILLIMAGVLFYIYSTYDDLVKEIKSVELQTRNLEKEGEQLPAKQKQLEEEMLLKQTVEARIPEEANVQQLIKQINDQSRSAGLKITKLEQAKEATGRRRTKPKKYEPIKMELECKGGYHALGQFINRIEERMERLVAVDSFSIRGYRQGLEPGQDSLTIAIDLVAYKFNNPIKKKKQ